MSTKIYCDRCGNEIPPGQEYYCVSAEPHLDDGNKIYSYDDCCTPCVKYCLFKPFLMEPKKNEELIQRDLKAFKDKGQF